MLELILFYAIPQGDVNPLAHELIDRFGSLDRVLDALPGELMNSRKVLRPAYFAPYFFR